MHIYKYLHYIQLKKSRHSIQIWPLLGQELGGWQLSVTVLESSPHLAVGPINEINVLWSSGCADALSQQTSVVDPVGWLVFHVFHRHRVWYSWTIYKTIDIYKNKLFYGYPASK